MTIHVDFTPETEAKLRQRAADAGKKMEDFVRDAVEEKLAKSPQSLTELLAEIHTEIQHRGDKTTESDLDALVEESRNEVYAEQLAKRRQP
ncbi:MAG TPA: hypothetical protein VFE58_03075 [Tepidisphaeraceae bacterium]|jgi:plasmid stability protein|nr:hypothetical protein [Tepidisphaeraceae bacterium]